MSDVIKSFDLSNGRLDIVYDDDSPSPREWGNLTTMVCFHKRYSLGDEHDYNSSDYSGFDELKADIIKREDPLVIRPLYLYDHSDITIATTPFSCRWDSGQIGFVFVPKAKVRAEWGVKRISPKLKEQITHCLLAEVEEYDTYLRGDVYGFRLYETQHCDSCNRDDDILLDSCYGFYGYDVAKNGILEHVSREVETEVMAQL